jgi:hypothetical protein
MKSIVFTNLNLNEQETLRGGNGYSFNVENNVTSGASASASQSQAQGQQAQQQTFKLSGCV